MGEAILAHAVGVSGGSNGSGGPVEEAIKQKRSGGQDLPRVPNMKDTFCETEEKFYD